MWSAGANFYTIEPSRDYSLSHNRPILSTGSYEPALFRPDSGLPEVTELARSPIEFLRRFPQHKLQSTVDGIRNDEHSNDQIFSVHDWRSGQVLVLSAADLLSFKNELEMEENEYSEICVETLCQTDVASQLPRENYLGKLKSRKCIFFISVLFLCLLAGLGCTIFGFWKNSPKNYQKLQHSVLLLGGVNAKSIISYNPTSDHSISIPLSFSVNAAGRIEDKIVIISDKRTKIYDPISNLWTEGPKLLHKPCITATATLQDKFYVCTGLSVNQAFSDACKYIDSTLRAWTPIPAAPEAKAGAVLAALGTSLYLLGGWNESSYKNSVFEFDLDSQKWKSRAPMNEKRAYFSAVGFNGTLIACGGLAGRWHNSCERYLPEKNVWEYIAPLNQGRTDFGLVNLDGRVLAMGGFSRKLGAELETVEEFLPLANRWSFVRNLSQKRQKFAAVVI